MSFTYVHRGLPSFMRAQLQNATQGGSTGYAEAGFTLGRHLADQCPVDADIDTWGLELARLDLFVYDGAKLAQWLRQIFPRIMAHVPSRRIPQFAAGVQRAHEEGLTGV